MNTPELNPVALASQLSEGNWLHRRYLAMLLQHLPRLRHGVLHLSLPSGRSLQIGDPQRTGVQAEIRLHSLKPLRRLLSGGMIGWAEGYLNGEWDSPDICALVQWAAANERELRQFVRGQLLVRTLNRLQHLLRRNSRRGSRRNIAYHYDLGNAFYCQWLDPSMTYSSALFHGEESLHEAQLNKYRAIARMLDLQPGQRVLEVGCGWGGFAELAAREFGVQVTGITLSREQLQYAQKRIDRSGLADVCQFSLTDYRDIGGEFDHVVSIEMFEAVGEAHWPDYFAMLQRCLAPGGKALLQVISIDESRFDSYRLNPDFIQRYIFPGGMLPSPSALRLAAEHGGFELLQEQRFGLDYAHTLAHWREAFCQAWPEIRNLGFDERFRRMWLYYLGYCEGGFRANTIDVGFYCLQASVSGART